MFRRTFTFFRTFRRFQQFTTSAVRCRRSQFYLALTGISIVDYGLSDGEIKQEADLILKQDDQHKASNGWETLVEEKDLRVYRRKLHGKEGLYEYKCSGTYYDITARNFVDAQCDVDYRREWDTNVLDLQVLADDPISDTQVVRWVAKYPFPMNARVYIYVRRKVMDEESKKIIVTSQAINGFITEKESKYVQVTNYRSNMIINSHRSFDENGFDYVLTYHDDPQANIPNTAYNWIVNRGGPYFLKQVHNAAKKLEKSPLREKAFDDRKNNMMMFMEDSQKLDNKGTNYSSA